MGLLLESTAVEVQVKEEGGCVGSGGETCSYPVLGYKVTQSRSGIIALLVRAERGGPCCVQWLGWHCSRAQALPCSKPLRAEAVSVS